MTRLVELAAEVEHLLSSRGWEFCFIGGIAIQYWGTPRLTRDVDLCLFTGFGGEERFIDVLLGLYEGRLKDARQFAIERRILLLKSPDGIGIDVSLAALPFEERFIQRSAAAEVMKGTRLRLCSPEDLVILKIFAGRALDIEDARSVLVRQGLANLDLSYIESELNGLNEVADHDLVTVLAKLVQSL
jgi:hypothetical protein